VKHKETIKRTSLIGKSTRAKPDYVWAWRMKGYALFSLNQLNEAESALRKATELGANDTEVWTVLSAVLLRLGRNVDAAYTLNKVGEGREE
jgi:Flp pilus assembly protein TadD